MRCNERIKFAALLEKAIALGFDAVCTGHYAKVIEDADGNPELHRAADWAKDQSYVLGVLTHEQLKHSMFPLADTPSKAEVRAEAERRGLSVANKPDSHDICFIPDGDTAGWLAEKIDMTTGDIVDETGTKVGEHPGANAFTVGQRRGPEAGHPGRRRKAPLCAGDPAEGKQGRGGPRGAAGHRRDPRHQGVLGRPAHRRNGHGRGIRLLRPGPCARRPRSRDGTDGEPAADGAAGQLVVTLTDPLRGVAPGQTVVLYQGSRVLGQATIDAARSLQRAEL